jgi:hypothetical protein
MESILPFICVTLSDQVSTGVKWMRNPFNFSLKFGNGCKIPSIFL